MPISVQPPLFINPTRLIVSPENEGLAEHMLRTTQLSSAAFRKLLEPGLREMFKDAWELKGYRAVYGTAGQ